MAATFQERMKGSDGCYGAYEGGAVIRYSMEVDGNPAEIEVGLCLLPRESQECKGANQMGCKNWIGEGLLRLDEAGYLNLAPEQSEMLMRQRERFSTGPCGVVPERIREEAWQRVDRIIESEEGNLMDGREAFILAERVYEGMVKEDPGRWGRLEPAWP